MTATVGPRRALGPVKPILLARSNDLCMLCGKPIDLRVAAPHPQSFTADHIWPYSRGGCDHLDNLQAAHFTCNAAKGNRATTRPRCYTCTPLQPAATELGVGAMFGLAVVLLILAIVIGWVVYVQVHIGNDPCKAPHSSSMYENGCTTRS